MQWLLYVFASFTGLLNPLQSGCNSALVKALGWPFLVALISLGVSLCTTLLGALVVGQLGWPPGAKPLDAPWYAWVGGIFGACYLVSQPVVAPRLGAGTFIGLTVTTSTIISVTLDHFGALGFPQHTINLGRIAGLALMIAGVTLVAMF
jgi:transporter family-2 protein